MAMGCTARKSKEGDMKITEQKVKGRLDPSVFFKPPNESGIDPVEEFKNIVEHLLSFANEK